jgi:hypothetical protein
MDQVQSRRRGNSEMFAQTVSPSETRRKTMDLPTVGENRGLTMTSKKGPPDYRDSGTGKFVTERYAQRHPRTTEKEHNRPAPKSPPSKRK